VAATQNEKAVQFRSLHNGPGSFVIANAWDIVSARMLASLGYQALATSSGAMAACLGRRDGKVTREEALAHCCSVVAATDLPVSADLERGFADAPEQVAETIHLAASIGLVGASIEDASADPNKPIYEIEFASARVAAAAKAARAQKFPFILTARAENFLRNRPDLGDTIARLRAYEAAGADVLFAPGLPDLDAVKAVCSAVSKPVNFMVGIKGRSFTVAALQDAGVRRISLATSLYRAAMGGLFAAAEEIKQRGTFDYLDALPPAQILNSCLD
jgi:2-methylisocitrate lyase-like PEP mutase family enzyme